MERSKDEDGNDDKSYGLIMEINLLLLSSFILVSIYFHKRFTLKNKSFFLLDSFVIGILFYAIGSTYLYFDTPLFRFNKIVLLALITLISGLLGALAYVFINPNKRQKSTLITSDKSNGVIDIMLFFCVLICLIFIISVFSNQSVAKEIASTLSGVSNYTAARKSITSGSNGYFAPGYIKQFRDILGPICLVSLILLKKKKKKILLIISSLIIIFSMLLSGQRSVIITLLILYFFTFLYPQRNKFKLKNIYFISLCLFIFYYLSLFIGRVDSSISINERIINTVFTFFERLVLVVPYENSVYFPFWWESSTGGASWLSEIERILPGSDNGFSNTLHSLNKGSLQGNSVLGLPIDLYYAFGFLGVTFTPFLYSLLIGWLDASLRKINHSFFQVSRVYLFIALPLIYSPYGFLLYGGGIILIVKFFLSKLKTI